MSIRLPLDTRPLRDGRDLRLLLGGRAISALGSAVTMVAAALQAYGMTHSSLAVGALGAAEVVPMVAGMLIGGAIADAADRRLLVLVTEAAAGVIVAGLAVNAASGHPRLWLLFLLTAASGAAAGLGAPARPAAVATLVTADQLPAAVALNATVNKAAALAGPAAAGLVIARFGVTAAFAADAASYFSCALVAARMRPLRPGGGSRAGLGRRAEGLGYLRRHRLVAGLLLIDVNAMVFGMPSALFPAIGTGTFHGGAATVGLLYAAPAAGALAGALTSGWIGRVRHAGRVLLASVAVWGLAICGFGVAPDLPVGLVLLALAGAADLVSEVLRSSLLQLSIPDRMRGRLSALWLAQANAAPALGNLEAGSAAAISTPAISVISGGLACILGAALVIRLCPVLARARLCAAAGDAAAAGQGKPAGPASARRAGETGAARRAIRPSASDRSPHVLKEEEMKSSGLLQRGRRAPAREGGGRICGERHYPRTRRRPRRGRDRLGNGVGLRSPGAALHDTSGCPAGRCCCRPAVSGRRPGRRRASAARRPGRRRAGRPAGVHRRAVREFGGGRSGRRRSGCRRPGIPASPRPATPPWQRANFHPGQDP